MVVQKKFFSVVELLNNNFIDDIEGDRVRMIWYSRCLVHSTLIYIKLLLMAEVKGTTRQEYLPHITKFLVSCSQKSEVCN